MASTDISLFAYEEAEHKKEKSPTALRTISEAAEIIDVPQHVLRFWETKFTQIKPLKRNGGRRFYRPQDIDVLQQIKHLLYNQGYTIKGAKKAVDDFLNARTDSGVSSDVWMATVPPASVNDNVAVANDGYKPMSGGAEAAALLADIASALNAPVTAAQEAVEQVAVHRQSGPSLEVLHEIRGELASLRDSLRRHLPAGEPIVYQ